MCVSVTVSEKRTEKAVPLGGFFHALMRRKSMDKESIQRFDEALVKLSDAFIALGATVKTVFESIDTVIDSLPDEYKVVIDHGR